MGGQDRVLEKIKSFAHQELNTKEIIEKIPSQIQNNEDPFQRRYTFEQYQGYLPELIYSNNEYLEYFALDQKQAKRINIWTNNNCKAIHQILTKQHQRRNIYIIRNQEQIIDIMTSNDQKFSPKLILVLKTKASLIHLKQQFCCDI